MIPHAAGQIAIKICGLTTREMTEVAVEAGADAFGIVFASQSPRFIGSILDTDSVFRAILAAPPVVGVFQVEPDWRDALDAWLDEHTWCQIHGDISLEEINSLPDHARVIRAIPFDADAVRVWDGCERLDALLIDAAVPGSGEVFDHAALANIMPEIRTPVILAGGLTPDTVADAIRAVRPAGVDVSSGVESARGTKDADLIRAFCEAVRRVE